MHIHANRENMMAALVKVGGVVERRQTLPILGNLLISATEDSVKITGTDLELEICATSEVTVKKPGEVTLPARKLIDICRALPESIELSIKMEGDRALLAAGRSRFALSTLPPGDFPLAARTLETEQMSITQNTLKHLFEKTAFAMAHQDVRYYLNGLLLEVKGNQLIAVATDGHRLAKVEQEWQTDNVEEMRVILPRKTVLEMNRLLAYDSERTVTVDLSEKVFRALVDDMVVTSKVVDGRYPDYAGVIPSNCDRVAHADRESLRQALLRTAILSNEKFRGVRLGFGEGRLKLQAQNPEKEEAEEEMEVDYAQEPTVIGFNVGYLIDVLNVLDGEEVEIGFADANSSAVLRSKGDEGETYVVMPMRL